MNTRKASPTSPRSRKQPRRDDRVATVAREDALRSGADFLYAVTSGSRAIDDTVTLPAARRFVVLGPR